MNYIVIIVIVLVICHSILINLKIKGNHENYASETMSKQLLVTSHLVVSQLQYRLFILISISHSKFHYKGDSPSQLLLFSYRKELFLLVLKMLIH